MKLDHCKINTRTDLLGAMVYLIKNKSYNIARFKDKKLKRKIEELLSKEQFDVVIFESIYTLAYLDLFIEKGCKVILRAHNVEHEIWEQLAKQSRFSLKRWYFSKLAEQLKKYELTELLKLDGIISISEDDAKFFQRFAPKVNVTAIPTAVKTDFPVPDYKLNSFYFLGAMDWRPNKEGVGWLLKEVIPNGLKGLDLHIAGKALKEGEIKHPSVICHGEVKDARDYLKKYGICVIPMLSGSGIKIKLLENMAMGKPIVTTSEGTRGVDVEDKKHVLIADDPEAFRSAMYELAMNNKLRKTLGQNAKQFVIHNFGEEKLTRRLIAFIKES
jgi:glycosyltransferase involved in cell wall biosynthesis